MRSIEDISEKIKGSWQRHAPRLRVLPDDLFLGLIIVLVAFGSFGLGRLSKIEGSKVPIRVENAPEITTDTFKTATATQASPQSASIIGAHPTQLIASKNGKKYYYPWCAGVQKITEVNRIYFASKADAETQGLTPSATCKGL